MSDPLARGKRAQFLSVLLAVVVVASLATAVPLAGAASEAEPNDDRSNAQSIQTGTTVTGAIQPSDDTDWFAFTARKGQVINVTVFGASGSGVNDIKLKTRDGSTRGDIDVSAGGSGSLGTTATYTGTYYVQVSKDFFASEGTGYDLEASTYGSDGFEANEDRGNATRIAVNGSQSGDITIGDTDWFAITAQRGETINVTTTHGSNGANDVKLYPKGDSGWVGDGGGSNATGSIGTTARYTGTYYIRVKKDFFASQGTDYTLQVETYRTDTFEPNENRSMASPLFENPFAPAEAQLSIGDVDYFKYDLAAGETLRVKAGGAPTGSEHKLRLYRPGDDGADNRTSVGPGEFGVGELTAQTAGTHYIGIVQGAFEGTGGYNVTITAGGETVGPPNDRFEARAGAPSGNQDRASAIAIDSGTYGNLGMVDDDRDVFSFRAAKDARVVANVSYDSSANDLSLALTDGSGTTVATGGDGLAVNVSAAGTYYLEVTGQAGVQAEYTLELDVISSGPPALPGQSAAPVDIDGDGLYEDIDGSGQLSVIDVSILLGAFDRVSDSEASFYDYNEDGTLNILDVAALLNRT